MKPPTLAGVPLTIAYRLGEANLAVEAAERDEPTAVVLYDWADVEAYKAASLSEFKKHLAAALRAEGRKRPC